MVDYVFLMEEKKKLLVNTFDVIVKELLRK
jgi:hypothetical protein